MTVFFYDMQQSDNPMNGTAIRGPEGISELFRSLADRPPFLFELRGDDHFIVTVGLGADCVAIQHSARDGLSPYFMAVNADSIDDQGTLSFLAGGTPTPIPRRFCLPTGLAVKVLSDLLRAGSRSGMVDWEEI